MRTNAEAAAELVREAFEGRAEGKDFTWFVEDREAILPTLDAVDAMAASHSLGFGLPTIAAHAYHLRYSLGLANVPEGDAPPEGDWESTWKKGVVTSDEWDALRAEIRGRYERFVAWTQAQESLSTETLAPLPHFAYHLGAIRVLLKLIEAT